MWPPCLAPVQPHGSHPHVTLPGPQRCPCWHWTGYDHQSGSGSSSIHPLELSGGPNHGRAGDQTVT